MTTDSSSRLDRLEALAETVLLAIHELSNRQNRTQDQLDQLSVGLDQVKDRLNQVADQQAANAEQIAVNTEQIAANTAGLVELRHLMADFVRTQRSS